MLDAEKIMRGLAEIAVDHTGYDDLISDAIALITDTIAETDRLRVSFAKLAAKSSQQQAQIERRKEAARA